MKKNTPFAAQIMVENVICMLIDQGMKQTEVMISGPSLGRNTTLRAIQRISVILNFVRDMIPMPHNGCRPPKKRCV
jgi:small subunit ribosomal protein S11